MNTIAILLSLILPGPVEASPVAASATRYRVYVGTYTGVKSKGVYLLEFDSESGKLTSKGLAAEAVNPSFLAIHPEKPFLYAVNEIADYEHTSAGSVTAFSIDSKTGRLRQINRQSTRGGGPCHLSVVRDGKVVLVANYGGGSLAALPIRDDGGIGPVGPFIQHHGASVDAGRQKESHAHSIQIDLNQRFVISADLGLDRVFVYRLKTDPLELTPNTPPFAKSTPGSGPRHVAFHPDKSHVYVINELKSTVTAFGYDGENGALTEMQTISTLPENFKGSSYTADIHVHPSGKFLYGSNRGHDSIAVFTIEPKTGRLTAKGQVLTGGKTPRNFAIDPTGRFLLAENQDSDTIVVFKIDQETGGLTRSGEPVDVPSPVCVKFLPIVEPVSKD